MLILYLFISKS